MVSEGPSILLPVTLPGSLEYMGWEGYAPPERRAVAREYVPTQWPWTTLRDETEGAARG
jgi:hypothetical protein